MAILFFDGFDTITYGQITRRGWTVQKASNNQDHLIGTAYANGTGQGLRVVGQPSSVSPTVGFMQRSVASSPVIIIGFDFRRVSSTAGESIFLYLREGSTVHLYASATETGVINVYRGDGTLLGSTTAGAILEDTFGFVELEAGIDNAAGFAVLSVNGEELLTITAADTRNGGTLGEVDQVLLACSSPGFPLTSNLHDFDHVYVLDDNGAAPLNAKLGPIRVDILYPTSNSGTPGFTPSAGTNYQNVDDTTPDDDATYNQTTTPGAEDRFGITDLPSASSSIFATQLRTVAKRSDAGLIDVIPAIVSSGTQADGVTQALGSSYIEYTDLFLQNPDGDIPWDDAAINALEIGYRTP